MVRKKTLAEELEELATTAPTRDHDPEDDVFGDRAIVEGTDDELELGHHRARKGEKGLTLRGAIELDDPEYAGRRVSRDAVFGDESEADVSEDEDIEDDTEPESEEGEELREEQSADENDQAVDGASPQGLPADAGDDEMDAEASALEREFEAARSGADADAAAAARRDRAARERAKGLAVRNQRALWERMLELRILLQGCLQASNRLVRPHMHAAACATAPELRSGLRGLSDGAAATLDSLLDLHDALLGRVPDRSDGALVQPSAAANGAGKKRSRDAVAQDDSLLGVKWARINAAYGRFAPYRDASMDRWHRKTMLMTGTGAMRNNLRALNQSLSSQVAALVKDSGPAVQRTQLMKALVKPLMGHASLQAAQGDEAEDEENLEEVVLDERDAETFDDGEFYQQLLKEFLESSGADTTAINASVQGSKKKRKNVDRRASKGRKLRYQVMDKLVHFMAPVQRSEPPALAAQLFANLFGQSKNTAKA
ncbi:g2352 [Coccomyxa elongata]